MYVSLLPAEGSCGLRPEVPNTESLRWIGLGWRLALPPATLCGARAQVLKEEILPALERLRREKGQFLEWQAAGASIERLRRFCVAYRLASTERCARAPAGAAPAPAPRAACKC